MSRENRRQAACDVVAILPDRADDVAQLGIAPEHDGPIVTIIGKYNHGKSRGLNGLIGREIFAVADQYETVRRSGRVHPGRWLGRPGVDADLGAEDERHGYIRTSVCF